MEKNSRMSGPEFEELVEMLRPSISPDSSSPNSRTVSAEKMLAVTLYYSKDTGANTFGLTISTVSGVIL